MLAEIYQLKLKILIDVSAIFQFKKFSKKTGRLQLHQNKRFIENRVKNKDRGLTSICSLYPQKLLENLFSLVTSHVNHTVSHRIYRILPSQCYVNLTML